MDDNTTDDDGTTAPVRTLGRRGFFATGGVAAAGLIVAACGDDDESAETDRAGETDTEGGGGGGDAEIAGFAAGLELLAANTYAAALEAAGAGKLGEVPPAVAEFATTAQAHHQAYSDALAEAAGGITPEIPADIQAAVDEKFAAVTDVNGLAAFARDFENQAAATYMDVIPKLEGEAAIKLTGSILPVTRQREAILNFVMGEYPVPETFFTAENSLAPG